MRLSEIHGCVFVLKIIVLSYRSISNRLANSKTASEYKANTNDSHVNHLHHFTAAVTP